MLLQCRNPRFEPLSVSDWSDLSQTHIFALTRLLVLLFTHLMNLGFSPGMIHTSLHSSGNQRIKIANADISGYIRLLLSFPPPHLPRRRHHNRITQSTRLHAPYSHCLIVLMPQFQLVSSIDLPLTSTEQHRGLYASLRTTSFEISIPRLSQTPLPSPKQVQLSAFNLPKSSDTPTTSPSHRHISPFPDSKH